MDDKVKRYAMYLLVMAGLGGLLYGIDVGVIAAALPYIENTAAYTKTQIGFVVGMVLWGSVISSPLVKPSTLRLAISRTRSSTLMLVRL